MVVREGEENAVSSEEAAGTADEAAKAAATPECATDDARLRELRQRKDELTQRHREHERRKQQLRVSRG